MILSFWPILEGTVNTSLSNAGDEASIPGQGAKILHALWPKNLKHKNRSSIVIHLIKTLKNGPYEKIFLKRQDRGEI